MTRPRPAAPRAAMAVMVAAAVLSALSGCTRVTDGAATWPGAALSRAVLTAADFPPGVHFRRVADPSTRAEGAARPPAMLSEPAGCSDGLTRVLTASGAHSGGSDISYAAGYDGARLVLTVVSWPLDLDALAAVATRCAQYRTFFDRDDPGIPMTTTTLDTGRPGELAYRQTMQLGAVPQSVYYVFADVGDVGLFGVAYPVPDPTVGVRAALPQTLLDVAALQAGRLRDR